MKVVLFCGGFGTRLREFSHTIPKPLVPIGYRPILWYLMKYYAHFGHTDFILCLGYRGDLIKEFFLQYDERMSNDFMLSNGGATIDLDRRDIQDWKIRFVDTGLNSNLGRRLTAVREFLDEDEVFLANYTDGVTNLKLDQHVHQFIKSDAIGCFVAVRPSHSLSGVQMEDSAEVTKIEYLSDSIWINGGFFVFRREIFDYIEDGEELVEEPFQRLIRERKLRAFRYPGFWAAMDTFKDKKQFDHMYEKGERPWEVWNQGPAD